MIIILLWVLTDTWLEQRPILYILFDRQYADRFKSPLFQLIFYAAVGGGIGGVASGIRSNIYWHFEENAYGARFILKDLIRPLLGALLAFIVYILVRIGFTILSHLCPV
jgi:hypothetical protein